MASIYDVNPNELIEKAAQELKKVEAIQPPEWAPFVRTGMNKDRPPVAKDWWYYRTAAVLRKIYKMGPIGVSKLRKYYGGKKNRGVQPEKFFKGSGNILRKVLQQLEKAEFAIQVEKGNHKGRTITPKGKSFLDKIATQIRKSTPKVQPAPKVEAKPAPKPAVKAEPKPEVKETPKPEVKAEKKEETKTEPAKEEVKVEKPKEEAKAEPVKEEFKIEEKKEEPVKEKKPKPQNE